MTGGVYQFVVLRPEDDGSDHLVRLIHPAY
jgi:hypothetical protein